MEVPEEGVLLGNRQGGVRIKLINQEEVDKAYESYLMGEETGTVFETEKIFATKKRKNEL